jgi:low-affinity ferrous iron transport protein
MYKQIIRWLSTPGAKGAIQGQAPTQLAFPKSSMQEEKEAGILAESKKSESELVHNVTGYVKQVKPHRLDRWLDFLVAASGSQPVFLFIVAGLLVWALTGIRYGQSANWAALMSDIQAIISYLFDSLLMRQQHKGYERQVQATAGLRSRNQSQKRMLRQIHATGQYKRAQISDVEISHSSKFDPDLPSENWSNRAANYFAAFLGHFGTICMYWVCIIIWIGFGHFCDWSDRWQLYINSATSSLMVLIFAFLANIRERHTVYIEKCLNSIYEVDSEVELKLRLLTADTEDNPVVVIPAPHISGIQRAIFYYADVIGTLVGIALLIIVMIIWVCIGPAMQWNDNWWLLIGTYAGLVGLIDGFVLRNVQERLHQYQEVALDSAKLEDVALSDELGLPCPEKVPLNLNSVNYRLSNKMGVICAHEVTIIIGVLVVIGLLVGASAMKWNLTGQLLCNIPPSIIESFFMMILITGHNLSEAAWRADLDNMYLWRLRLLSHVDRLERADDAGSAETPAASSLQ